ncbi:DEAD/DEAH box helicase family protein [Halomonas nitroreducens]|uniref:DEAD/DEAH box helicase family protein n=1 Tax=Halomonas nitroreducens TaxID=447425 RepID=UPI001C8C0CC2|nr:DEAD/DEAH box helicase family protein [Halomonas nitroreducens]
MDRLPEGLYEKLIDEELQQQLAEHPDVKPVLRALDDEAAPHVYSQFVAQLLTQALRILEPERRRPLLNRLLDLLSATDGLDYLRRKQLLRTDKPVLSALGASADTLPRPVTPLATSTLLTGLGHDPPLEHELRAEMATADHVDILVSFIKWSGLRLLMPAFERLAERGVPVRLISTSYMGASDPTALEWLVGQPNVTVRVSYDTGGTRLHAKAYHFLRDSGFSTAYIGSANMSHSAMTQGLEWTVKVTAQDMTHILDRFAAEFSAYWESEEFEPFTHHDFRRFRQAIAAYKARQHTGGTFFADISPRPFQLRILEALEAARQRGSYRNLVVAATGTGKTVVSALDYRRYCERKGERAPLLFVAHRKEILEQALACFRAVLRDQNFGELWVGEYTPNVHRHLFASVQTLNRQRPWGSLGAEFFHYVVIDEAHHGAASSYRALLEALKPDLLLGLTATPERMDGSSILPDFDDDFAAEIRLAEALEEKLLCPFHYFGVSDSIDLSDDRLWQNGRYDMRELENLLTGDDFLARQRVDTVLKALERYQPNLDGVRAVGFCAGVRHAEYMTDCFNRLGEAYRAAVLLGDTSPELRDERLREFRDGRLPFLFTVDVLSEGVDVPDINLVMFLRPTESLTVFLQQLGRGLRHAPGKECLTVLDFVGQTHRRYRVDTKFTALLSGQRQRLDREVEADFPSLPPGCSIQLERVARQRVLSKIRSVLNDLNHFIPEALRTWSLEVGKPLTFGRFLEETGLSPVQVLAPRSWSEWKAKADRRSPPP